MPGSRRARALLIALGGLGALLAGPLPARPGGPAPAPPATGLQHFIGPLHTHTGYSDGQPMTTPASAYAAVRARGLNFLAVTEHSEALRVPMTLSGDCLPTGGGGLVECALADTPANALDKWDAQRRQAVAATVPGSFLGLRGFELTNDVFGHMNVYFSRSYVTRLETGEGVGIEGFYQWLRTPAAVGGGADGLATFNHPNDKKLSDADPRKNWNDFAYVPDLDDRVVGIEVFNGTKNYETWVTRALDKGWHLGVIGAEDIHSDQWGANQYAKTVLLAPRLTVPDLKDAMQARRMYATLDKEIRISLDAGGRLMGSRVKTADASIPITAHVDGGDVAKLELITNGAATLDAGTPGCAASTVRDLTCSVPVPATGEEYYLLRVTSSADKRVAYSSPVWISAGSEAAFVPHWVAGDLHVHTTYSHDVCDTPPTPENCDPDEDGESEDPYTWGWDPGEQVANAESRGLDFMVITDHNDTRSVYDAGYTSDRVTLIPGYENSLAGHVQMIGAIGCYDQLGLIPGVIRDCNDFLPNDRTQILGARDALRADGGAFQINHPSDGKWLARFGGGDAAAPIVPDTVEVWNIGPWHYQHPAPASNDNDFSLAYWQTFLDAGDHVAATGGSDNHWRSTFWGQGVGQPTTWVWVTEPGWQGVVNGIRAGRTFVSHEPPALGGQRIFLEADVDGDGAFEAMVGDTVTPTPDTVFRVRADNLLPGSVYRVVSSADVVVVEIPAAEVTPIVVPAGATWVRVELRHPDAQDERMQYCDPNAAILDPLWEAFDTNNTYCRNRLVVEALTSPIYLAP